MKSKEKPRRTRGLGETYETYLLDATNIGNADSYVKNSAPLFAEVRR